MIGYNFTIWQSFLNIFMHTKFRIRIMISQSFIMILNVYQRFAFKTKTLGQMFGYLFYCYHNYFSGFIKVTIVLVLNLAVNFI